ncbi:MAG TPA: hypothetical protein VGG22_10735 [Candidatus Baltobacteraceae bacterium]
MKRAAALLCALFAMTLFATSAARATAVVRVQQNDGSTQVYRDVHATLSGTTLWLRSPDRKDRLQIVSAACSFPHELQRCLPFQVFLHKPDRTHQIAITHGVFYVNLTAQPHHLLHSSEVVAPHSVIVFLHTSRGTYFSATGHLDAVK